MIYGHGDDQHFYANIAFDFSSNVNPYGISNSLQKHLTQSIKSIKHYPEPMAKFLAQKIEKQKSVHPNSVLITNGAVEAIYLLAALFAGSTSLIFHPTFSEYEDACRRNKHQLSFASFDEFNNFNFSKFKLAWICNPNNPTGELLKREEIIEKLQQFPQTTFIVDEAYVDFTSEVISVEGMVGSYPNLIVLKSLTKIHSIPGIRLGYMIAARKILLQIGKDLMPWRINQLAIEAGLHCFSNQYSNTLKLEELLEETKQLQVAINTIEGFVAQISNTPFFVVKAPCEASKLKAYLIDEYQILIRDASNFRGLSSHHFRIATQQKAANQALINALQQWK